MTDRQELERASSSADSVTLAITMTIPAAAIVQVTAAGKLMGFKRAPTTVPGLHQGDPVVLRFVAPGYAPVTKTYTMTGHNDAVVVAMQLVDIDGVPPPTVPPTWESSDAPGKLKVVCVPRSTIILDGKKAGTSIPPDVTVLSVEPGTHLVMCESDVGAQTPAKEFTMVPAGEDSFMATVRQQGPSAAVTMGR